MDQDRIAATANRCPRCSSPRALPRRAGNALVVASLPVLILALAACGSSGLTAQQTAQKLGAYLSPRYRVQCNPAAGRFWDYACKVTPPPGSKNKPYKLKVTVGPHGIVDKAVCGARTGTELNC
jgi:hypothetical protein